MWNFMGVRVTRIVYFFCLPLLLLISSCSSSSNDDEFKDGWYKAYVEIISDKGGIDSKSAYVSMKQGLVEQINFSPTDSLTHFDFWTKYDHSQDVSYRKGNDNIYTVYIIPKEWNQGEEQQRKAREEKEAKSSD